MKTREAADALHRCAVKIFAGPNVELNGRACIPIFHRWIQSGALDGLLIDVARLHPPERRTTGGVGWARGEPLGG